MDVPKLKMNDGRLVPAFGLGTWQAQPGEVEKAVKLAIDLGYRHFDCARVYLNEAEVGAAIREKIKSGNVKREDIFVTTKLWNTHHKPELVVPACKTSLQNFGLEYLDLYLVHWPFAFQEHDEYFPRDKNGQLLFADYDFVDTWKEMEKCVELGLVKSIGVSNFNSQQIERVLKSAKIKPAMNQIECHPYLNQKKLIQFCRDRGVLITAYSPLGSPSRPWGTAEEPHLLSDPKLIAIANRVGKTPAQVALRYLVQSGTIPIPKSTNPKRLLENIDVFNFKLDDKEMKEVDKLNINYRYCRFRDGRIWFSAPHPFKMVVVAPLIKLNNGKQMPVVGLGTFKLQGEEGKELIKAAIDAGYRHFDTALLYHSEKAVGGAIREKIADGTVKREDIFVTSKLWCSYAHPGLVIKGCKRTLENLGLDYVDLYLIHWSFALKAIEKPDEAVKKEYDDLPGLLAIEEYFPRDESGNLILADTDYVDTWKQMEELVAKGMAKSIGISNFNSEQIDRLLQHATIKPVVNQVECHPYFNQKKLLEFCKGRDIVMTAYSPLSAGNFRKAPGDTTFFENPKILTLAKELNRTPAQVILRFLVQWGAVVIPKSGNVKRIAENIAIFDFTLSPDQMAVMESLNRNNRYCIIPGTEKHKYYAFNTEF